MPRLARPADPLARARRRTNLLVGALALTAAFAAPFVYWSAVIYVPPFHAPSRDVPTPNGYDRALAAFPKGRWRSPDLPGSLKSLPIREQARLVRAAQPALNEVRRAFAFRWLTPPGATEAEYVDPTNPLRNVSYNLQNYGDYFAMESRDFASQGRMNQALGSALDAMELGGNACRGGAYNERYVAQACQFAGLEETQRLFQRLPLGALTDSLPRVRRIRESWPTISETVANERVIALEKCTLELERLRARTFTEQLALAGGQLGAGPPTGFLARVPAEYLSPGAWAQVLTPRSVAVAQLDHFYRELAVASDQPAPNGVPTVDVTSVWSKSFARSSFTGRYRGEWPRNNLAILEVALAARAFQLERGRHPVSPAELSRSMLPEVPVDVWGHPIRLRVVGSKCLVYSIGPDGADDGARAVEPDTLIRGGRGDLVFGKLCDNDWLKPRQR